MKYLIALLAVSSMMVGCTQHSDNDENSEAAATVQQEEAPARVVRERQPERSTQQTTSQSERQLPSLTDPARNLPQLRGQLDSPGDGLEMIIDGSSPDAFLQSLEIIAGETSEQQYQTFHSSMLYLRVSSLDRSEMADFYQTLDGRTAEEVIEMAARLRVRRGR